MASSDDVDLRTAALFNTSNIALARSQKILQSWLPSTTQAPAAFSQQEPNTTTTSDPDFTELTDLAGLGSLAAKSTPSDLPDKGSVHNKLSANDRLREQIMGKKAANRHKQSTAMTAGKSMAAAKHAAPKPVGAATAVPNGRGAEQSSEDEGEGRAGSFKSKKAKVRNSPIEVVQQDVGGVEDEAAQDEEVEEVESAAQKQRAPPAASNTIPRTGDRPAKRKGGSYLDELLAEKSRKKNKKKKKAMPEA